MTSECPGDTGNASATARAWALLSRIRSAGIRQNGQSVALDSLIVAVDALPAGDCDLFPVIGAKLPPQARLKPHEGQVAVITHEAPALERLEWFGQHQPGGTRLVQFVHRLFA